MEKLNATEEVILSMVRAIVTKPEEVELKISEESDDKGEFTQINIKVAEVDIPRAIGKGGATAEAIRRIAVLVAINSNYERMIFVRVDAPKIKRDQFSEVR